MTKIYSYNVNGIRSAMSKNLVDWIESQSLDIICFQEIKALEEQIDVEAFEKLGFNCFWFPAKKKGYSGVAILSKHKPNHVEKGNGIDWHDEEGRVIRADYDDFSIVNIYFPSGSSGDERQSLKMKFLSEIQLYIDDLRKTKPKLLVCGDYNICHKPIDIHDPIGNKDSSGFLPEERDWLDGFLSHGFIDSFRMFNETPHNYTWWSYRANARMNNKGWRIDYISVSENLRDFLKTAEIFPDAKHSDHCPISITLDINL